MIKILSIGLLAGHAAAAPTEAVEATDAGHKRELYESLEEATNPAAATQRGRELFPLYAIRNKCARFCANPQMSASDSRVAAGEGPVKQLEMLALNDDLNTVVYSGSMCTRRHAMARAAGLAAGLALGVVNQPGFAAETKSVKMGSDSGQLVFVPDEITICKGDTVTWVNNKGGPHNVVFDEDEIPKGVAQDAISMDGQLGEEGQTFSKKFDVAGSYSYYCEPHRGAGMNAVLTVE